MLACQALHASPASAPPSPSGYVGSVSNSPYYAAQPVSAYYTVSHNVMSPLAYSPAASVVQAGYIYAPTYTAPYPNRPQNQSTGMHGGVHIRTQTSQPVQQQQIQNMPTPTDNASTDLAALVANNRIDSSAATSTYHLSAPAQLKKSVVKPPNRDTSCKTKRANLDTASPATSNQRPKTVQRKVHDKVKGQHKEVEGKETPSHHKSQHTAVGTGTGTTTPPSTSTHPHSDATTNNRQDGDGDVITPVGPASSTITKGAAGSQTKRNQPGCKDSVPSGQGAKISNGQSALQKALCKRQPVQILCQDLMDHLVTCRRCLRHKNRPSNPHVVSSTQVRITCAMHKR